MSKSNLENLSNQLSQALAQQATLSGQLQKQVNISNTFKYLFNSYRELKAITLNPLIVITKTISAEELAHTDVLKEASKSQHSAAFDLALAKITDLDHQDIDGKTVLMHAIINGFYYGVDKLLQKGADVNLIDKQDANALIYCVQIPHIKYIKQIAEKTTDINYKATFFEGNTALHLVIANTQNNLFYSEVLFELKQNSLIYMTAKNTVVEVEGAIIPCIVLGVRESDGYTIEQEKTLAITKFLTDRGGDINAQNDKGLTPFFLACTHKFNYLASCFVNQFQLDFSIKDFKGNMSLHYATLLEDTNILQLILNKGVDINSQNSGGGTALSFAICNDKKPMVEFLLNKGADVNVAAKDGRYPLHLAVSNNSLELIDLLAKYGNINARTTDEHKVTALWLAAQDGKLEIVKMLASLGADLNIIRTTDGTSPLYVAIQKKQIAVVKELLARGADTNIPSEEGWYPWHGASSQGFLDVMQLLFSKNFDINLKTADIGQYTALWLASQYGHIDIVKWLIDCGADLNIVRADTGYPPLYIAMHQKRIAVAEELLARGADINIVTANGWTALHCGVYSTNKAMVEILLNKEAEVNVPAKDGWYPWHVASFQGSSDVMQLLFLKNPDINLKTTNVEQYTALWLASQQGHSNIVKWLAEHGADVNIAKQDDGTTALQIAIVKNYLPVIKVLVEECKADINKTNLDKTSPLYYSLGYAGQPIQPTIVKFLVSKGANVSQSMYDGDTPLHMASYKANVGAMKLLLNHGASVDTVNEQGKTPLQVLIEQKGLETEQKLTAVKYLLERSAATSIKNKEGKSAIDLAKDNFPEALPWLEHPENLPPIGEFEASLVGINDFVT